MASTITRVARLTSVAVHPATKTGARYRSARAGGFPVASGLNAVAGPEVLIANKHGSSS